MVFIPTAQGSPPSSAPTSVTMGGDVTGQSTAASVVKLRGRGLSATAPTNGQALVYTSTSGLWVPGTPPTPIGPGAVWLATQWYPNWLSSDAADFTFPASAGGCTWAPFPINAPLTISAIGCYIATAGADQYARLGIYADDGSVYPGKLVLDAGRLAATSTGAKTATEALTLPVGLYWLAVAHQKTGATSKAIAVQGFSNGGISGPLLGMPSLTTTNQASVGYYLAAVVTGAFPTPAPSGAALTSGLGHTTIPIAYVKSATTVVG